MINRFSFVSIESFLLVIVCVGLQCQALQSLSIKYGVFQSIYNYWKEKVSIIHALVQKKRMDEMWFSPRGFSNVELVWEYCLWSRSFNLFWNPYQLHPCHDSWFTYCQNCTVLSIFFRCALVYLLAKDVINLIWCFIRKEKI